MVVQTIGDTMSKLVPVLSEMLMEIGMVAPILLLKAISNSKMGGTAVPPYTSESLVIRYPPYSSDAEAVYYLKFMEIGYLIQR